MTNGNKSTGGSGTTQHPGATQHQGTLPVSTQHTNYGRGVRPIPGMKYFAIATMIMAFLMAVIGILSIIFGTRASHLGNPVWSAIGFILPTGILGMVAYWKRTSLCVNVSYLVVCILLCAVCFQLMVFAAVNAANEPSWYCAPELTWRNYDYEECGFTWGGRISVDAIIAILSLSQMVLCMVSLAFTCYGTFSCCQPTPPAVVQYFPQNGTCQLLSVGGYQIPASYQPVSLMVPVGQNGQMIHSAVPVMAQTTALQHQPVILPANNIIPATRLTQAYPMNPSTLAGITPQMQGNVLAHPLAQAGDVPAPPPTGEVPAAPPVTPASPEGSDSMNDPLTEAARVREEEAAISYGQTASDYFHEERNLLDAV